MNDEQHIHLRHYLLGKLTEPEREALAERYFVDDELFDQLLEVENELFDQYARHELSPVEKKQFAQYIRGLPDGEVKLATAVALTNLQVEQSNVPVSSAETAVADSWWQIIGGFFFRPQLAPLYVLSSIILIGFILFVYFYNQRYQIEPEQVQVPETEKNISNQIPNVTNIQPPQNIQPQNQPTPKEKLAQVELPKENPSPVNSDKKSPAVSTLATLILTPAMRSENTPNKLNLKPDTKTIYLTIKLALNEKAENCQAILQLNEGSGPIVWRKGNLKSSRNQEIILSIPAKELNGGSYKLTLQGIVIDQIEIAPEYNFEIIKGK